MRLPKPKEAKWLILAEQTEREESEGVGKV